MLPATYNQQHWLPGAFEDAELHTLYQETYAALAESFRTNPALNIMHYLMAERLAYIYVRSIAVGRDESQPAHIERSFLDAFNKLVSELGKEIRTQSREGTFKQALITGIIMVLREELDNHPQLTERIMHRLEEL